jgi:hypothetical protein
MFALFKGVSLGAKLGIVLGIVLLFAATWYIGYTKGSNISKVEIAKYEGRVNKLNADLATAHGKVDVRVVTEYKDRVNTIDHTVYQTRDVIRTKVVPQFNFSKGWVYAYNQSVLGLPVDPTLASDASPSPTSDLVALLDTLVPNNGICLANSAQLAALQQTILEREAADVKINK